MAVVARLKDEVIGRNGPRPISGVIDVPARLVIVLGGRDVCSAMAALRAVVRGYRFDAVQVRPLERGTVHRAREVDDDDHDETEQQAHPARTPGGPRPDPYTDHRRRVFDQTP
ncbi:hypothetical protein ACFU90_04235 [Streptomyces noursei]|uniref:Uncharacterized protein n=2 Tax=Streptomyces noursei TaxID=1971 RepID=A0A401R9X1_STRNR|nr:hypothetical protein [Streptomyces noursei]AKA08979.1 hypothetical protein SAZ_32430 [Streptomyces noursei ZPM]EPY92504.1 hypothetical protein K530_52945 [Streptomyces noursei CCRC 11814]EXU87751.1 hypothetical protein P354_33880 [Streptomyces noursei PD-1]MCZ0975259.1 hypothetical protein [Streptomyces noursei]UWS75135.1 hypothetical protein N1H47_30180 [Streptomyces noursei]